MRVFYMQTQSVPTIYEQPVARMDEIAIPELSGFIAYEYSADAAIICGGVLGKRSIRCQVFQKYNFI